MSLRGMDIGNIGSLAAYSEADRETDLLAATVIAPVGGQIAQVRFWNPNTGAWQDTAPTINLGQQLGVLTYVTNPAAYAMNMKVEVVLKAPDGATNKQTSNIKKIPVGVGQDTLPLPANWVADLTGSYTVTILLYAEYAP